MRRLSIRAIMAVVVMSAIGLAALRNANELWAGMMLLTTLAMLGIATLGIIFLRAKERAWWAGFALFAGSYLAGTSLPWLSGTFRHQLGTTYILRELHAARHAGNIARRCRLTRPACGT